MRLGIAVSGGADSVALLRALATGSTELGLVLHVAHLHHGLRGAEADSDLEFCRELASQLGLPFHEEHVDTGVESKPDAKRAKPTETIEEAARRLRYSWFERLLSEGMVDAIATAHTFDDQAETVLAKFLRGAWTEGLAGISPKLEGPAGAGCILRPLLGTTRDEVEAYLKALGQTWREDSSNRQLTFTRNRIRHELLPLLETWNPQLREHLVHMAELARDEEAWWQAETARLAPQFLLPGKPVRGGGRAGGADSGLALDITRLAALAPALQRRLLRHAAKQIGVDLDFTATESLRSLALEGSAGQKLDLTLGLRAERTPRELRLGAGHRPSFKADATQYRSAIPGEIDAPVFGVRLRVVCRNVAEKPREAILRNWRPGDRVRMRYTSGPRKIKEVLERLKVTGSDRGLWPVLEVEGMIVWMKGVDLEPVSGLEIASLPLE